MSILHELMAPMKCFGICGAGYRGEVFKGGAIVSYEYIPPQRTTSKWSSSSIDCEQHRKPIPWVFSRNFCESYEICAELGRGAFSVVYEAYPIYYCEHNGGGGGVTRNESYAVKVVNRKRLQQKQLNDFVQEVSILSDLSHPNIIRLRN